MNVHQHHPHRFTVESALIELAPREGEHTLRTEDIVAAIEKDGEAIALVMFSGEWAECFV